MKKPLWKKWWFWLIIVIIIGGIIGSGGEDDSLTEQTANESVEEVSSDVEQSTNWEETVNEIAASDKTETEKADETERLARDYSVTDEELDGFKIYLINEFTTGNYLADITNHNYMLENIFKSTVVERSIKDEQNPLKKFAFDYYQNTKYTYRGVEAVDSESVKSNEAQMDKVLNEIK